MHWYVYLVTIAAIVFLSKVAIELLCRPIRTVLRLRREALTRMLAYRNISTPRPRELAVTSREIREYDEAVRRLRNAQRIFADLGARFLALGESEPAIRTLVVFFGLDIVLAGHELMNLSRVCAKATSDHTLHHEIENALGATDAALKTSPRPSHNALTRIKLEPIYLGKVGYKRKNYGPPGRQRAASFTGHEARAARTQQRRPKISAMSGLAGHYLVGWPFRS